MPGEEKELEGLQGSPAHGLAVTADQKTLIATSKWYGAMYTYSLPDFKYIGQVVVGSHRWNRLPTEADQDVAMASVEAPAGSVFAFESRIWHRTGANTSTNRYRAAVFPFYTTPIYRTQENWFLSLSPGVIRNASDTLLTLLAYKSQGFGLVYGRSYL